MPSPFRPPRPERLAWSRRRRIGMRLASGLTPARVAWAEAIPEAEVAALVAEPGFAELVTAFRDLGALPREERVARLGRLAWNVLERALLDDDLRVAMFVASEVRRGRDPGETVARGIVNACERAATTAPVSAAPPLRPGPRPPARPPRAPRPHDPAAGSASRGAAHARALVMAEHEIVAAAAADQAEPAATRPAAPAKAATSAAAARVARLAGSATALAVLPFDRPATDPLTPRWPAAP